MEKDIGGLNSFLKNLASNTNATYHKYTGENAGENYKQLAKDIADILLDHIIIVVFVVVLIAVTLFLLYMYYHHWRPRQ
jgi:hypothetical protein